MFNNVNVISKAPADIDQIAAEAKIFLSSEPIAKKNSKGQDVVSLKVSTIDAQGEASKATDKKSALAGKTVLWVEDDKFLSEILARKFVSVGCNIVRVPSSEGAFTFLETNVPDALILDILLPGMNGLDILQKVRMNPKLRAVPVLILSNTSQSSDYEKGKMLGAQKFLVKAAVSLDEIVREVGSLVH